MAAPLAAASSPGVKAQQAGAGRLPPSQTPPLGRASSREPEQKEVADLAFSALGTAGELLVSGGYQAVKAIQFTARIVGQQVFGYGSSQVTVPNSFGTDDKPGPADKEWDCLEEARKSTALARTALNKARRVFETTVALREDAEADLKQAKEALLLEKRKMFGKMRAAIAEISKIDVDAAERAYDQSPERGEQIISAQFDKPFSDSIGRLCNNTAHKYEEYVYPTGIPSVFPAVGDKIREVALRKQTFETRDVQKKSAEAEYKNCLAALAKQENALEELETARRTLDKHNKLSSKGPDSEAVPFSPPPLPSPTNTPNPEEAEVKQRVHERQVLAALPAPALTPAAIAAAVQVPQIEQSEPGAAAERLVDTPPQSQGKRPPEVAVPAATPLSPASPPPPAASPRVADPEPEVPALVASASGKSKTPTSPLTPAAVVVPPPPVKPVHASAKGDTKLAAAKVGTPTPPPAAAVVPPAKKQAQQAQKPEKKGKD